MSARVPRALAALALVTLAGCGAAPPPPSAGPSPDLRLRRVVLYQNGIGYFERTGVLREPRLRLRFRDREIDDVLKSIVVVEEGLGPDERPSTVSALLPQQQAPGDEDAEATLDLVLSPRTRRPVSIAYAVPTPAWKATYRVILPSADKPGRALLQAWALVDNASDEDWRDIRVTLATGAPLSFSSDLRTPRFIQRPEARSGASGPVAMGPVLAERSAGMDSDGDGIPDPSDACPREPGMIDSEPSRSGCPRFVRIQSSEIRILTQILFARGSDAIRPESRPIINEIVAALKSNPQIRKLAVQGHASSDERDPWNLASRRAVAVRAALVAAGVGTELTTTAFGDSRPIDSNATEEGRAKNRRVEFHIEETREQAPPKPAGVAQPEAMARTPAAGVPQELTGTVRYDIANLISIPRRSTTLVTLINELVPGEDTLLYRPDAAVSASGAHPLRAARIENRGALALQRGEVSIFAGGTFVGESLLDRLEPGETALIPYALDASTRVEVEVDEDERPRRILRLARGVISVENTHLVRTRYKIQAGRQAPPRMFLRHERRAGYEPATLPPGTETSAAAALIPLPLQAGSPSELTVDETQPRRRELAVMDVEGPELGRYLAGSSFPPEAEKAVREVVGLRTELGKIDDEIGALRRQLDDTAQRSAELRESIRAIERTPRAAGLQKTLLDRLTEATARSEALSAKLADRNAALAEARAQLTEKLRDLKLEAKAEGDPIGQWK